MIPAHPLSRQYWVSVGHHDAGALPTPLPPMVWSCKGRALWRKGRITQRGRGRGDISSKYLFCGLCFVRFEDRVICYIQVADQNPTYVTRRQRFYYEEEDEYISLAWTLLIPISCLIFRCLFSEVFLPPLKRNITCLGRSFPPASRYMLTWCSKFFTL